MRSDLDPGQYWLTVRRRKWWILSSVLAGALFGVGLNAFTTPVYRATTRVEIPRERATSPLTGDVIEPTTSQSENLALYTTAGLITNRVLLGQVVRDLRAAGVALHDPPSTNPLRSMFAQPAVASVWTKLHGGGAAGAPAATGEQSELDWLLQRVNVEPVKDTRLVSIQVEHWDPQAAERIGNTLAQAFSAYRTEQASTGSSGLVTYLTDQLNQTRIEIESREQQLASINARLQRTSSVEEDLRGRRQFYELLETKLRDAQITGQMLSPLIKIVEPANAGRSPIRPRKALNLAMCLFAGLTVGTGLAFMREGLQRTIRTPQDVAEHLQLPVLGLIRKGV